MERIGEKMKKKDSWRINQVETEIGYEDSRRKSEYTEFNTKINTQSKDGNS